MENNERVKSYQEKSSFDEPVSLQLDFNYTLEKALSYIKRNIPTVLFGPPGTGKTYIIEKIKARLKEEATLGNFELVQFHKKFSYEDFIEGFSPNSSGMLVKKDGVFKSFCSNASKVDEEINLFVIDELNRAELSTTLGEILYLLEDREERVAKTSHFADDFRIPNSVSILGTMNTADRNISSIDFAIRRRFRFIPLFPDYSVLKEILLRKGWVEENLKIGIDSYCLAAQKINHRISANPIMGRHMQLGHMMFVPNATGTVITIEDILEQFIYVLLPQIEAYCGFGNDKSITEIMGGNITNKYLSNKQITFDDIQSSIIDIANSRENERS